jgi:alpha-glucosidase
MTSNASGLHYHPVPTPRNTIICGKARFTLLTDHMLRLEWSADGKFEDRATLAVINRALPPVQYTHTLIGRKLVVRTVGFILEYSNNGKPFSPANLRVRFSVANKKTAWAPGRRDQHNLGATLRTLDGIRGDKRQIWKEIKPGKWEPTPTWVPVDLGQGFISRSGWALIDDSKGIILDGEPSWVAPRPEGERRDWYLFVHGHNYPAALRDASLVFGRQPLPPRYAFGYWWSRYWAYTDKEFESLVQQFDERRIPIDVMVVDMDWHLEGWTGYTWDKCYFPDPDDFLKWLKARDLKISLNLHPAEGVAKFEEAFPAMARAMQLDPGKADRVVMDITDKKYVDAYFKHLHHPMEKKGVDFWWMDWQQGQKTKVPGLDPLPWINHLHWHDMERRQQQNRRRPLIFSRFGGYGAGRYCIGFSGDTYSVWESLKYQPYFTATAANVLYGYWSHDIGGHMPGAIDPELYTRWLQFGVYSPVLRTHTTKNIQAERRVWAYPDPYGEIMSDLIRQRYEMVPYIYTEARATRETGISLCSPLYYNWPEQAAAYKARDQYMFGGSLLVAPIVQPADKTTEQAWVNVWLPKGKWFDTARGVWEQGGRSVRRRYLASEVPVFVRPGAIIPGQRAQTRIGPGSYRDLVVTAYPGGNGAYRLYEDDGVSADYQHNVCAWVPLSQKCAGRTRTITVGNAAGMYQGYTPVRTLEIRLPATVPPQSVHVHNRRLNWSYRLGKEGWTYDGQNATTIIRIARIDLRHVTSIMVRENANVPSGLALGLKGLLARLARVNYYNTLSTGAFILDKEERLGIDAAQTGNRVSRKPETFVAECRRLRVTIGKIPAMLRRLGNVKRGNPPKPDPERQANCKKALNILRATISDGLVK